jgi:hypothetical protein
MGTKYTQGNIKVIKVYKETGHAVKLRGYVIGRTGNTGT